MKKIKLPKDMEPYFDKSIIKWQKVVANPTEVCGVGSKDCGLCDYDHQHGGERMDCLCPIALDGHHGCESSPYVDYSEYLEDNDLIDWDDVFIQDVVISKEQENKIKQLAQAELDYLIDLKSRCEFVLDSVEDMQD